MLLLNLDVREVALVARAARTSDPEQAAGLPAAILRIRTVVTHEDATVAAITVKRTAEFSDSVSFPLNSILLRIGQSAGEMKACQVSLAADSRNDHHQARVGVLKIEKQYDTPVRPGVSVDKPVLAQI